MRYIGGILPHISPMYVTGEIPVKLCSEHVKIQLRSVSGKEVVVKCR